MRIKATVVITIVLAASAGAIYKMSWSLAGGKSAPGKATLTAETSNVIQDLYYDGRGMWVATTGALGYTADYGRTWKKFGKADGLPSDDVVAVTTRNGDIWASCIEYKEEEGAQVLYGKGLSHYDAARGTWTTIDRSRGLPVVGRNELAWDILVDDQGVVWVALWNGGIGKSTDNGATWELIQPKNRKGVPLDNCYSIAKHGNTIWAAVEDYFNSDTDYDFGIAKSMDNGRTWTYYGRSQGVVGFTVAVSYQTEVTPPVIWVSTAPAGPGSAGAEGVYKSDDGGATWTNYNAANSGLANNIVYGLASAGPWAWAGTYGGVCRTDDGGANWYTATPQQGLPAVEITTLGAVSETEVWAGTNLGVAYSLDSGATWFGVDISPRPKPLDLANAFAYPNPCSLSKREALTIRYALAYQANVTIDIFDYAGRRVTRLVDNQARGPGDRIDEPWDGNRDDGDNAAGGIYFFTIQVDGAAAARGKFVIVP